MRENIQARIKMDLMNNIVSFFGEKELHRTDDEFIKLCERIEGKEVTLTFCCGDAFETEDDNYWLPECCWEEIKAK